MFLCYILFFFFNDPATTEIYTLSLHDALPISSPGVFCPGHRVCRYRVPPGLCPPGDQSTAHGPCRSEEHTSELQSRLHLVCRLLLEKKKKSTYTNNLKILYTRTISSGDPTFGY